MFIFESDYDYSTGLVIDAYELFERGIVAAYVRWNPDIPNPTFTAMGEDLAGLKEYVISLGFMCAERYIVEVKNSKAAWPQFSCAGIPVDPD